MFILALLLGAFLCLLFDNTRGFGLITLILLCLLHPVLLLILMAIALGVYLYKRSSPNSNSSSRSKTTITFLPKE